MRKKGLSENETRRVNATRIQPDEKLVKKLLTELLEFIKSLLLAIYDLDKGSTNGSDTAWPFSYQITLE